MAISGENTGLIDSAEVHRFLATLVRNRVLVPAGMKSLAEFWQRQGASVDLKEITGFPYNRELKKLEDWFGTLWTAKGPPVTSDGLWFGLTPLPKGGLDLYAAVMARHGRQPVEWDWENVKHPKPREASSRLFKTLFCPDGVAEAEPVRHLMGLGAAVLIAYHLCHALRPELGAREPVVAAGYDGGDYFILGTARVNGRIEPLAEEQPIRQAPALPKGSIFRLTDSGSTTHWLLEQPRDERGREVSRAFGLQAKAVEGNGTYDIPIYLKGSRPDFSFTLSGIPVVRRTVAEIIEQAGREDVQRLTVTVESVHGEYEILNVLSAVRPQKLLEQSKKTKTPPSELSLGKHRIARLKNALLVSRDLAEELRRAGVSGISFIPLKTIDLE